MAHHLNKEVEVERQQSDENIPSLRNTETIMGSSRKFSVDKKKIIINLAYKNKSKSKISRISKQASEGDRKHS